MQRYDAAIDFAAQGEVQHRLGKQLRLQTFIKDDRIPQGAEFLDQAAGGFGEFPSAESDRRAAESYVSSFVVLVPFPRVASKRAGSCRFPQRDRVVVMLGAPGGAARTMGRIFLLRSNGNSACCRGKSCESDVGACPQLPRTVKIEK